MSPGERLYWRGAEQNKAVGDMRVRTLSRGRVRVPELTRQRFHRENAHVGNICVASACVRLFARLCVSLSSRALATVNKPVCRRVHAWRSTWRRLASQENPRETVCEDTRARVSVRTRSRLHAKECARTHMLVSGACNGGISVCACALACAYAICVKVVWKRMNTCSHPSVSTRVLACSRGTRVITFC